jgi:hypothetical protein
MSKQRWKVLSLVLASLLVAIVGLLSVNPLLVGKVVAQATFCDGLEPGDWGFTAMQRLVVDLGVDGADACSQGQFRADHPEVRADMADWLAKSFQKTEETFSSSLSAKSELRERLTALEQSYNKVLAEVETLEQMNR